MDFNDSYDSANPNRFPIWAKTTGVDHIAVLTDSNNKEHGPMRDTSKQSSKT